MKKLVLAFLVTTLFAGTFGFATRPAQADTNSTIAIAAAAIVGILLFDSNNQPYYVRGDRRYYVSQPVAAYYVQRNDPQWYSQHHGDWQNNRGRFAQDWNHDHQGNGGWQNNNGNGHGNGHHGH